MTSCPNCAYPWGKENTDFPIIGVERYQGTLRNALYKLTTHQVTYLYICPHCGIAFMPQDIMEAENIIMEAPDA